MSSVRAASIIFFVILFLAAIGCEPGSSSLRNVKSDVEASVYTSYLPVKLDIIPLTEIRPVNGEEKMKIDVYVSLLDVYGCQVKMPGVFGFE